MTKVCTVCRIEKDVKEFYPKKDGKNGRASQCRSCDRQYKKTNKVKIAIRGKKYYHDNIDYILKYAKDYGIKHKKEISIKNKNYYKRTRARIPLLRVGVKIDDVAIELIALIEMSIELKNLVRMRKKNISLGVMNEDKQRLLQDS